MLIYRFSTYAFTEKCTLNDEESEIKCEEMNPGVLNRVYQLGIALFKVEGDYCPSSNWKNEM